jgi:hypothetical protein
MAVDGGAQGMCQVFQLLPLQLLRELDDEGQVLGGGGGGGGEVLFGFAAGKGRESKRKERGLATA